MVWRLAFGGAEKANRWGLTDTFVLEGLELFSILGIPPAERGI